MLLVDPRREDAQIEETLNAFAGLITDRGGEIANWDRWGRRKLAYEIEDLSEGYYAVCTYNVESSQRAEIEAALPFVEGLVRSKTIRPEARTRMRGKTAAVTEGA
jgi:small subunit ribosomal protein S6